MDEFRETPFVAVVSANFWNGKICFNCFKENSIFKCTSCAQAWYCSKSCQQTDWTTGQHRWECAVFVLASKRADWTLVLNGAGKSVRLVARALSRQRKNCPLPHSVNFPCGSCRTFDDLLYRPEFGEDAPEIEKAWQLFNDTYRRSHQTVYQKCDKAIFTQFYGKIGVNSHSIVDYNLQGSQTFGQAVYLLCSKWNHSCDPDLEFYYDGSTLIAHPIKGKDISNKPVNELTIPYCYMDIMPTADRRRFLRENYLFDCSCQLCLDTDTDRLREYCIDQTCKRCGGILIVDAKQSTPALVQLSYKATTTESDIGAFCCGCKANQPTDRAQLDKLHSFWESFHSYDDIVTFASDNCFLKQQDKLPLHNTQNSRLCAIRTAILQEVQAELNKLPKDDAVDTERRLAFVTIALLCQQIHLCFKYYGVLSPNHARIVLTLAKDNEARGRLDDAIGYYRKARDIWATMYHPQHKCAVKIDEIIQNTLTKHNRTASY